LQDSLALVAERGRMIQSLPVGAMLAVPLSEVEVQPWLSKDVSLAAINAPASCVLSAPTGAIDNLEQKLTEQGIRSRRLATSHAFHSTMMDPILVPFAERFRNISFAKPQVPFISNVTGTWSEPTNIASANYWVDHLRRPVRFADGVTELGKEHNRIFLEAGFGRTLCGLVKQQLSEATVLATLKAGDDISNLLETLGELWLAGARVDWTGVYRHEDRRRVPLPTYPFERKRYWLEPTQNRVPIIGQSQPVITQGEEVSLLEKVMSEQIDLMTQQLELLGIPPPPF